MENNYYKQSLQRVKDNYGPDIKELKKHKSFRHAWEIYRNLATAASTANLTYRYGPAVVEYATNTMNSIINYGNNIVEAVNYLSNADNYLVSVTEDDYVPIGEDDPMFDLELETGDSLIPAEETVGTIEESTAAAEENSGFFESIWDGFVDTVEGAPSAIEGAYETGGVVEAAETALETVYEAVTAGEVIADTAEVIAGFFFL